MAGSYWSERRILVTGGASFIGSHLVDSLVAKGAEVTVVDDLSSGALSNLSQSKSKITFVNVNLEYISGETIRRLFKDREIVFHLAANHGGRGYLDSHPADVCSNFAIDHHVLEGACEAGVERVIVASSACVYPPSLQDDCNSKYLLKEEDSDAFNLSKPLSADVEYGWAKLMMEVQLLAFVKQYGLKGTSMRFVTAYGERENETHAIIALIHKAHERMDPYVIWGNGEQSRDFTYVSDIVDGTILAAERVDDGRAINLGTGKRFRIREVAATILEMMNFRPKMTFDTSRPVGVINRALDISRAQDVLGWKPKVSLSEGLERTINWYVTTHVPTGRVKERILVQRN